MAAKSVLIVLVGVNIALLGGTLYLNREQSKQESVSSVKLVQMQERMGAFFKEVDEFGLLYGMLQKQHQKNSADLEHLIALQVISNQLGLTTLKEVDVSKRTRLIEEMRVWMKKRFAGSVYIDAKTQQLQVLLGALENLPREDTIEDIQKTVMDIIQTSLQQAVNQDQRFFMQTEQLKHRIVGLEKSVKETIY